MAAENLNKSKLKTNTSTRKSTLTLVTLPSFSISGEISAEKMQVENCKIYRRLYDWGYNMYVAKLKIFENFWIFGRHWRRVSLGTVFDP